MAQALAHKFGQMIGDMLEAAVEPLLKAFAEKHQLYLDKKGRRPSRSGTKVSWVDLYGNSHDLDFVLEKGGSDEAIGAPVAFIETAWRSYTKHSRNKAQEIQGAILPLVGKHVFSAPFTGAILAGRFTEGALAQLKSLNFKILFFPYHTLVEAFGRVGIDANFDEQTQDNEIAAKIAAWERLSAEQRMFVARSWIEVNQAEVDQFLQALEVAVLRQVHSVRILPLHGTEYIWETVQDAIGFVQQYDELGNQQPLVKYEIHIRYNNGDSIDGRFADKESAIAFLSTYQPLPVQPA
jgi:hypothetical protein